MLSRNFTDQGFKSLGLLSDTPYIDETVKRGTKRFREVNPSNADDEEVMVHTHPATNSTSGFVKSNPFEIGGTYKMDPVPGELLLAVVDLDRPVDFWDPANINSEHGITSAIVPLTIQQAQEFFINSHRMAVQNMVKLVEDGILEFVAGSGGDVLNSTEAKVEHLLAHRYAYSYAISYGNSELDTKWSHPAMPRDKARCINFAEHFNNGMMYTDARLLASHVNLMGVCRGASGLNQYAESYISTFVHGDCTIMDVFPDIHETHTEVVLWIRQKSSRDPCYLVLKNGKLPNPKGYEMLVRLGSYGKTTSSHDSINKVQRPMSKEAASLLAKSLQGREFDKNNHTIPRAGGVKTLVHATNYEESIENSRTQPLLNFYVHIDPMDQLLKTVPFCGPKALRAD